MTQLAPKPGLNIPEVVAHAVNRAIQNARDLRRRHPAEVAQLGEMRQRVIFMREALQRVMHPEHVQRLAAIGRRTRTRVIDEGLPPLA
jgi:hypothetical protein